MTTYYEDLDVGETFETGCYTLTKDEMVTFSEQFDPQPFHVDEEAARDTIFDGLVASGLHVLCLSIRLFIDEYVDGSDGIAVMSGMGMDELRWHEPVYPDQDLRVQVEVLDKRPSESRTDRGYVDLGRSVWVGDRKVMSHISYAMVRRAESGESRP